MLLRRPVIAVVVLASVAAAAGISPCARADEPVAATAPARVTRMPATRPYAAVEYQVEVQADPPQRIYVATVDLRDKHVSVHVARGGPDPDGDGPWQGVLARPSAVAKREGFEVAVNGDFFAYLHKDAKPGEEAKQDVEGSAAQALFKNGIPSTVTGPAATNGVAWARAAKRRPVLVVSKEGKVTIDQVAVAPAGAREVIAGSHLLLKAGEVVAPPDASGSLAKGPHPRTAVGVGPDGATLVLVVVDGRRKGLAAGMSLTELAGVMRHHGCRDALNLDGGGSSVLVIKDQATGEPRTMNSPTDGKERAVGNVLGIDVADDGPAATAATAGRK